uniref:Uncharacterized protein n=1 Tax=Physcomitrium patens TaxID=3218 RepID=A0A2K1IW93_PHYPA|nr:hypothetical protein PHYPA_025482 [Physcomitrium patens]
MFLGPRQQATVLSRTGSSIVNCKHPDELQQGSDPASSRRKQIRNNRANKAAQVGQALLLLASCLCFLPVVSSLALNLLPLCISFSVIISPPSMPHLPNQFEVYTTALLKLALNVWLLWGLYQGRD